MSTRNVRRLKEVGKFPIIECNLTGEKIFKSASSYQKLIVNSRHTLIQKRT